VIAVDKTPEMTQDEMVEVLKAIIRDGKNGAARIAAIKELRAIQGQAKPAASGFEALDGGSAPSRRLKAV
jgi:hypothetical protein